LLLLKYLTVEIIRMMHKRILSSLLAVTLLIASIVLAFVGPLHRTSAQAAAPTLTDMYTQGGGWDPWGTAFDSTGRVWIATPSCDPSPQCGSTTPGQINVYNPQFNAWPVSYKFPAGFGQELFLAFDKSGRVWFPMPMSNSLGMFDPSTNTFNQWAVPTPGAGPWGVAIDSNGVVWFTEHYANKIGSFNPTTHTFTEIATSQANSQPYGITVDSANNVWFTENNSSVALIGEYTAQHSLHEYKIRTGSTNGLTPHLITTDHKGNVWWSEGWPGAIGKLVIAAAVPGTTAGVTEYLYKPTCASCGTHTSGIAVDKSGAVWFTDSLQSILGTFNAASATFSLYNTPTSNSHPHDGLNIDASNNLWFTEEFANKLGHAALGTGGSTPTPTATVKATATAKPTTTPIPGTILGQDTFHRANQSLWGKASDGHTWGGDANTATVFSISGNQGLVSNGNTSYSAVLGSVGANTDVVFTGSISSFSGNNFGAVLRWTDSNNWYKAYIDGATLIIQKKVNGATTILAQHTFAAKAATAYMIDFRISGPTLGANVWVAGTTEPSGWMALTSDSSFASGYAGVRMQVLGGSTLSISAFKATATS
jgi:streptogramin lyase